MIAVVLVGGVFRSLQFTSVNVIAYAEVEPARMSRATSLVAVAQQLSQSVGVALGALALETVLRIKGQTGLTAEDFPPAFLLVGLVSASSILLFASMPADAGAEMATEDRRCLARTRSKRQHSRDGTPARPRSPGWAPRATGMNVRGRLLSHHGYPRTLDDPGRARVASAGSRPSCSRASLAQRIQYWSSSILTSHWQPDRHQSGHDADRGASSATSSRCGRAPTGRTPLRFPAACSFAINSRLYHPVQMS
jgi:hypothetical protein